MDYKQIKQNSPKAWGAYMKFMEQHVKDVTKAVMDDMFCYGASMQYKSNTRHLYDFFDSYEIFVNVFNEPMDTTFNFGIDVLLPDGSDCIKANSIYANRPEAEEAAFTKAFEILEQQLNK